MKWPVGCARIGSMWVDLYPVGGGGDDDGYGLGMWMWM